MKQTLLAAGLLIALGCSNSKPADPTVIRHDFPAVAIGPYQEITNLCQSWTVDNDEPVFMNSIVMDAGPMWHHANWFFVPETMYEGEDGSWDCDSRGFDEYTAALSGGVLYAMSTQATHEVQQFTPGAVLVIPPRSRIVGDVHLLNYTGDDIPATNIALELHADPDYDVALKPMSLAYYALDLPPNSKSRFEATCDLTAHNGQAPVDFNVYYLLPHYHYLGVGMDVSVTASAGDMLLFETDALVGEPLGKTLDPPLAVTGGTSLTFACNFNNTTTNRIGWGVGDQEMCVFLAFTDDTKSWAGGVFDGNQVQGVDGDGTVVNTGPCDIFRL